jgi:hypothetical protein
MPEKSKQAKKMPSNFYDMPAFVEKDKKVKMQDVFGVSAKKTKKKKKSVKKK